MRRLVVAALVLLVVGCNGVGGDASMAQVTPVDPASVSRTGRPNDYLVCPPDLCAAAPDRASRRYRVSAERLAEAWSAVVAAAPRTRLVAADPSLRLYTFEQRSAVMGFRDTILVRFIPLAGDRSTLAVYSRSEVGYWDLGVNRRRVEAWLAALDTAVPVEPSP